MVNKKINELSCPQRESFFKELLGLLKEMLFNALECWIILLDDLSSFRNFLVVATFLLVIWIIQRSDSVAITTIALGFWEVILAYYFFNRQKSDDSKK